MREGLVSGMCVRVCEWVSFVLGEISKEQGALLTSRDVIRLRGS